MSAVFVDESKAKGYTMVAVVVAPDAVTHLRQAVRSLVLPGQRRIHFTKESDPRKRLLLSRLGDFGARAQVFHCSTKNPALGREACLQGIVAHVAAESVRRVVIERDESIEQADRKILFQEVRRHDLQNIVHYDLAPAHSEPLLWVADAIAWSYSKGGEWKHRIKPLVAGVTQLSS